MTEILEGTEIPSCHSRSKYCLNLRTLGIHTPYLEAARPTGLSFNKEWGGTDLTPGTVTHCGIFGMLCFSLNFSIFIHNTRELEEFSDFKLFLKILRDPIL